MRCRAARLKGVCISCATDGASLCYTFAACLFVMAMASKSVWFCLSVRLQAEEDWLSAVSRSVWEEAVTEISLRPDANAAYEKKWIEALVERA